jgi:hypothetical protein
MPINVGSKIAEACFVAWFAAAACGNKTELPPVNGDCKSCVTGSTTSGGTYRDATAPDVLEGGGDERTSRDAGSVSVRFGISSTNDTSFATFSPYNSLTRVSALGATGDVVTTGDITTGDGSLDGVASGPNWFAVRDPDGTAKILPTLQPITVDSTTPIVGLIVIPTSQLTPLTIDQQPWVPLKGRATLILIFDRGGRPLDGISIGPTLPAGASVAYEQNGAYLTAMNNPDIMTDIEGTAIVRDIANAPVYPAMSTLKFGYRFGTAVLSFEANVSADFVTWMTVAVP